MVPPLFLWRFPLAFLFVMGFGFLTIDLQAEKEIRLVVRYEDQPVANAAVILTQTGQEGKMALTTDAQGLCRLPLKVDRPLRVTARVSKQGFVPLLVSWNTSNAEFELPKELILSLEKNQTIGGVVLNPEGQPIAGAELLLIIRASSGGRSQEIHNDIWEKKATTDAEGKWSFSGAPASLKYLSIRLAHPEYVDTDSNEFSQQEKSFFEGTARLAMVQGRVIEGTVRDSTGQPLKDVDVLLNQHGADSTTQPSYKTDAAGHYKINNAPQRSPGLRQDGTLITFFKKGYAPEMNIVPGLRKATVVDVVLSPGQRLTGQVVDQEGKPVQGAWVVPDHWRGVRPFACARLQTDAQGRFTWEEAPTDEVVFDFLKEGYLPSRNVPLKAGEEKILTLSKPVTITGTVVDAGTGKAIPDFTITPGLQWANRPKSLHRAEALSGKDGKFQWVFDESSQLTESDGKIIDKGGHFLRFQAPGYFVEDSRLIKDTEGKAHLEIRLKKGAETVLRVFTAEGKPATGALAVVDGEGYPVQIVNGGIMDRRDRQIFTVDAEGRITLPPMAEPPSLIIADPALGFAMPKMEETQNGVATLTPWGRVIVQSPAITEGSTAPFYLNYEPLSQPPPETQPSYYLTNKGKIIADGSLVFEGVKPGMARIGRFRQADDRAAEVPVTAGETSTISLPKHDGIASIHGKMVLPPNLSGVDWGHQRGSMQTSHASPPWPEGLSMAERRKWLEDSQEGKKLAKQRRSYHFRIAEDGTYQIPDVAPGRYTLSVPAFSGRSTDDERKLLGVFSETIIVPTKEEVAKDMDAAENDETEMFLSLDLDPPFYPSLNKGDALPEFKAQSLAGIAMGSDAIRGKKAVLIFFSDIPEQRDDLASDLKKATEQAQKKGVRIYGFNTDTEKATAEKLLKEHPIPVEVAWISSDDEPELLKKFGPVSSPTVFVVDEKGLILGRFESAVDAMKAFP